MGGLRQLKFLGGIVLILLGLRWLPKRWPEAASVRVGARLRRGRDLAIAVCAGIGMTFVFLFICLAIVAWIFKTGYRLKT